MINNEPEKYEWKYSDYTDILHKDAVCYERPKDIAEQVEILRNLIPGIGLANKKLAQENLPTGAEGWFAIPKWWSVGKTYEQALRKVLKVLGEQLPICGFTDNCCGNFEAIQRIERTAESFKILSKIQKHHNILVIAAQFGLLHYGGSVPQVREAFSVKEFGLGAFEVACMILTHPERLGGYGLQMRCPGDICNNDFYPGIPCFVFDGNVLVFTTIFEKWELRYGSVTGFLPDT